MNETARQAAWRFAASAIRDGYKPEALHTYSRRDGGAWYWRIRLKHPETGDKWIRPMRVNGVGFELGEPEYPDGKPLYRLHVLEAARPEETVWLVEGEWCADKLSVLGLLTTTSGAADSAAKADWRPLAGRDVTIWPDNDEAGQRYATEAAERLLPLGRTVRVIDVGKLGLPEKGDAVDWLKANPAATVADVIALPCIEARRRATAGAKVSAGGQARPDTGAAPGGDSASPEWQEPKPIQAALHPVPAFEPDTLLPEAVRGWIMDEADRMPCPPDFIAVGALVSLGAIIGARCAIKPKSRDDWLIVPNLWGGIVGLPSAKKSPAIDKAMKPQARLIAQAMEEHRAAMAAFETDKLVFEAKEEAIKARIKAAAKDAKKGNPDGIAKELQVLRQQAPEAPILRRYKSNDTTVEKLGELLRENPTGLLVMRDELVGLIASWDKEGREGDRAFFLEAWNGNASFDTDRIKRGSVFIPNLCVSIFGGIQPDKLTDYLEQAPGRAVVWPENAPGSSHRAPPGGPGGRGGSVVVTDTPIPRFGHFRLVYPSGTVRAVSAGAIHRKTLKGFREAHMSPFAGFLRRHFTQYARLLEFQGGLPKREAQIEAARMVSELAQDLSHPLAALREALADHPTLLAQVPADKRGRVTVLPWGPANFIVRNGELRPLRGEA